MEYLNKIDLKSLWTIIEGTILPHSGMLISKTIVYIFIGVVLSIVYCVFLYKKNIFKRKPKYYNWIVNLYIPILFIGFLYLFGQLGLIKGIQKVLHKEKETIALGIYNKSISFYFDSEESKNKFITKAQSIAEQLKDNSIFFVEVFKLASKKYNTGNTLIDSGKNKLSGYLVETYGDDLYKAAIYGVLNLAGARAHVNVNESLPYNEFSTAMDLLLTVGYSDIEKEIKQKITLWISEFIDSQHQSFRTSILSLLLLLISLPLIEFFIYKKWIEK